MRPEDPSGSQHVTQHSSQHGVDQPVQRSKKGTDQDGQGEYELQACQIQERRCPCPGAGSLAPVGPNLMHIVHIPQRLCFGGEATVSSFACHIHHMIVTYIIWMSHTSYGGHVCHAHVLAREDNI